MLFFLTISPNRGVVIRFKHEYLQSTLSQCQLQCKVVQMVSEVNRMTNHNGRSALLRSVLCNNLTLVWQIWKFFVFSIFLLKQLSLHNISSFKSQQAKVWLQVCMTEGGVRSEELLRSRICGWHLPFTIQPCLPLSVQSVTFRGLRNEGCPHSVLLLMLMLQLMERL